MKSPEMTASVPMTGASFRSVDAPAGGKMRLTRELLSPYRGWIVIILLAMLGAILMYVLSLDDSMVPR